MTAFLILDTRVIPIQKTTITIGRQLENDIVIQDAAISRMHAEIREDAGGHFFIKDLDSTGGTYLNGQRIQEVPLNSGDSIQLASTPLVFVQNAPTLSKKARDKTGPLTEPGQDNEKTIIENKFIWRGSSPNDKD